MQSSIKINSKKETKHLRQIAAHEFRKDFHFSISQGKVFKCFFLKETLVCDLLFLKQLITFSVYLLKASLLCIYYLCNVPSEEFHHLIRMTNCVCAGTL